MRSHARKREPRRGRESNPRIEVLQTPTLPLGYPAILANGRLGACNHCVNVATVSSWRHRSAMRSFVRPNFLHRSELSHPNPRGLAKHLRRELNNAGAQSVTLNSQLMKKNTLLGATLALMVFAAAPLFAQTSTSTSTTSTSYVQSSSIIGSKIKDARGQDVGEIKDVVLDRSSGCLAYVVLSTHGGGTTTTTTKTVAAPWTVFSASSEPRVYMTRVEREKIYSAPVWESTRIEEYSRPEYINQVYGYYGVTPSFSVGVTSTGTTGTTTTGATTTTNSSASTNASATPAASAGATMTPAATASVAATMTPSASAIAKPMPSATAATAKSQASTKSPATSKSPAAESATSPKTTSSSEKKSSTKKSQ